MIHQLNIIARIAPHPTHYNKAREAICEIIEQTRAEPGCMEFRLSENAQDGTLYLYEVARRGGTGIAPRSTIHPGRL